jgi:hypothetical protein
MSIKIELPDGRKGEIIKARAFGSLIFIDLVMPPDPKTGAIEEIPIRAKIEYVNGVRVEPVAA